MTSRLRRHESLAVNCDDELADMRDAEVVALRRRVRELEAELTALKARWLAPIERELQPALGKGAGSEVD